MKIYLAGSMSGGREFEAGLRTIGEILKRNEHEIVSEWVLNPAGDFADRSPENLRRIARRDLKAIENCDAAVVEISQPSFGVGIELAWLASGNKPVLCLRHRSLEGRMISALVVSNPNFEVEHYDDGNLGFLLDEFLGRIAVEKEGEGFTREKEK